MAFLIVCGMSLLFLPALGLHVWPAGGSAQLRWPASILLLVWVGLAGLWTFTTAGRRRL
jgi:hypothetical protein